MFIFGGWWDSNPTTQTIPGLSTTPFPKELESSRPFDHVQKVNQLTHPGYGRGVPFQAFYFSG